jgi:hypothetical protein
MDCFVALLLAKTSASSLRKQGPILRVGNLRDGVQGLRATAKACGYGSRIALTLVRDDSGGFGFEFQTAHHTHLRDLAAHAREFGL